MHIVLVQHLALAFAISVSILLLHHQCIRILSIRRILSIFRIFHLGFQLAGCLLAALFPTACAKLTPLVLSSSMTSAFFTYRCFSGRLLVVLFHTAHALNSPLYAFLAAHTLVAFLLPIVLNFFCCTLDKITRASPRLLILESLGPPRCLLILDLRLMVCWRFLQRNNLSDLRLLGFLPFAHLIFLLSFFSFSFSLP